MGASGPSETNRSFAAFNEYLQMGPQRSLSKLAQKLGKSTTLLSGWSSARHDWMRRVRAFQHYENRNDYGAHCGGHRRDAGERHAMLGHAGCRRGAQTRILKMNEQEINGICIRSTLLQCSGSAANSNARRARWRRVILAWLGGAFTELCCSGHKAGSRRRGQQNGPGCRSPAGRRPDGTVTFRRAG